MKAYKHIVLLVTLACCTLYDAPAFAQDKVRNQKNSPNLSLNITDSNGPARTSYFNMGFMTNLPQLKGVGVNVLSSIIHRKMVGLQVTGAANMIGIDATGLQIAGIANVAGRDLNGLQISGLMNVAGNDLNGIQASAIGNIGGRSAKGVSIGGLINIAGRRTETLQIAGLANIAGDEMNGAMISGLINVSGNGMKGVLLTALMNINGGTACGLQIAGIGNVTEHPKGMQLAGISNIATDRVTGFQLSGALNIAIETEKAFQLSGIANVTNRHLHGVQLSLGNYAGGLYGTQIGLLNLCGGNVRGVQIGLINHSKDTTTIKIGLVNVNPRTRIQMLAYGGTRSKTNLAVRFLNHYTYTMLGIGTHYVGWNEKFSGCLFYRAGLYFPIRKKIALSSDLGYYHIETFGNKKTEMPKRMYAVQPRLNVECLIGRKLSLFVSGGYSWTRHYDRNKTYEHKPLVEWGVVLF